MVLITNQKILIMNRNTLITNPECIKIREITSLTRVRDIRSHQKDYKNR